MFSTVLQVLSVYDVLLPGHSRQRGVLLYELHLPAVLLANRALQAGPGGGADPAEVVRGLTRGRDLLRCCAVLTLTSNHSVLLFCSGRVWPSSPCSPREASRRRWWPAPGTRSHSWTVGSKLWRSLSANTKPPTGLVVASLHE